jgi:hypothetical protein
MKFSNIKLLNFKNILADKFFIRWAVFLILISVLFSLAWIWLNPQGKFTPPEIINSDVLIMGGSLGAAMAAIQLSRDNVSFVLVEPTEWLGGQATVQSVSTLDQNNRAFQQSGIYAELVNALKPNVAEPGFYGNALTGPGATPEIIDGFLKSQITSSKAKILYNSELLDVSKENSKITSIRVRDKKIINKQSLINAKVYLDGADFAELSRTAGIPYNFGLDTQEETQEKQALTEAEKNIFINGVKDDNNIAIGGFKDRMQPVTVPFTILDKGYFGDSIDWTGFVPEIDQVNCLNLNEKCWQINDNSFFELTPNDLPIWLSFVSFGDQPFEIQVNGKTIKPNKVDQDLARNIIQQRFELETSKEKTVVKFILKANQKLQISNIFTSNYNKIRPSESESLGDLTNKTKLKIDPIYKKNQAKFEWFGNQKEINTSSEYILYYVPSENKDNFPREVFFTIAENGKEIADFKYNPILDYFPGYLPIKKLTFNTESKYTVAVSGESINGTTLAKNLLVVPASQVNNLIVLNPGDSYSFVKNGLFDAWQVGGFSSEIKLITRGATSLIKPSNYNNPVSPAKAVNFLDRYIFPTGSTIFVPEKELNTQVFLRKLNLDHYAAKIWSNIPNNFSEDISRIEAGKYEAYVFYQNDNKNSINNESRVDINIQLNGQNSILRNIPLVKSVVEKIGDYNLSEIGKGKLTIQSNCGQTSNCLENLQVVLLEATPELYNPNRFDALINNTNKSEKKLLERNDLASSMFGYRQIIDYGNIKNWNKLNSLEKSFITPFSLGISQINTGFNDFIPVDFNYNNYLVNFAYRKEIFDTAKNLSEQYYYWLKYDDPINHLGCLNTDIFCSGLRISKANKASLNNDIYSLTDYIRDPVRLKGQSQITFNQIAWENNSCPVISFNCIELKLKDQKFLVAKDFLTKLPPRSIAPFYYPTDVHTLVKQGGTSFLNYLVKNNFRDLNNQPSFINGMYDLKIKPSSISLDNIYNSKIDNLLFCGKNISISQIANGSTRLHPSEAAIGQACGIIASNMIKYSLNNVTSIASNQNFARVRMDLIAANIYTTPLEDVNVEKFKSNKQTDLLQATLFALEDDILSVKISQDKNLSGVSLSADLNNPAVYQDLVKLFGKTNFSSTDAVFEAEKYKVSDLKQLVGNDDSKYKKLLNTISDYKSKISETKLADKAILENTIILRGDIAYVYYILIKEELGI